MITGFNREILKIRGMIDETEAWFLHQLAAQVAERFKEEPIFCEIGSFCGKSTVSLASALAQKENGKLYAIDWHEGSPSFPGFGTKEYKTTYDEYLENLEKFGAKEKVRTIKKRSEDAIGDVPDKIHLLWIDGLHEYDGVKSDYKNYEKKLVRGGFLLFHDACWTDWADPFRLIKEEVLSNKNYNLYAIVCNTMIFRKEDNAMKQMVKNILCALCEFVSGINRPWYKKVVSFFLFRLTKYYTLVFHDWNK